MPSIVVPEDAPEPSEVHNFLTLFFQALTTLNHDEMVLAIVTFFPLVLGLNATMRWMSGRALPHARSASHDAAPPASRTPRLRHNEPSRPTTFRAPASRPSLLQATRGCPRTTRRAVVATTTSTLV